MQSQPSGSSWRTLFGGVCAAALLSCAVGCTRQPSILVTTTADTNKGKPMHMMIRLADEQTAISEPYATVADRVYLVEPDPSVVEVAVVIPGTKDIPISFSLEEEKDIVVYFFFTNPEGQRWFVPIKAPIPEEIYIELGDNSIRRVTVR